MEKKLDPRLRRLLRILSDGGWYARTFLPPSPGRTIPQHVVNACIEQKLVKAKSVVVRPGSSNVPVMYQTVISITALGKKALKTGKY